MKSNQKLLVFFLLFFFTLTFSSLFSLNNNYNPSYLSYNSINPPDLSDPILNPSESIANQTYYLWNGTSWITTPWSGSENYTLTSPNVYSVDESVDAVPYRRDVNDQNRIISNSNNTGWGNGLHDPFWIFTNVSLGDTVLVAQYDPVGVGMSDFSLNVTSREKATAWGKQYECWKLTELAGPSVAYYDVGTGFLINGSFKNYFMSMVWINYTIFIVDTNAQSLPSINILQPSAPIYYEPYIPIVVQNNTPVDTVWFRNSTDGGGSWSANQTLNFNGTYYTNSTTLTWNDGNYTLEVFANNTNNDLTVKSVNLLVSTAGPNFQIINPLNVTYFFSTFDILVQNSSFVDSMWFRYNNGTGWTSNSTINYNGSLYLNDTITWPEAGYHLQIFANDSFGLIAQREQWFTVSSFPVNLSASIYVDLLPKIEIDSNNNVHVVWIQNASSTFRVIYQKYANGIWYNPIIVYSSATEIIFDVDLAIDPFNVVHLSWIGYSGLITFNCYYTNNAGGSFTPPSTIPAGTLNLLYLEVSIATDSLGNAHLALTSISILTLNVSITYTNNIGGSFSDPIIVKQDPVFVGNPAIAIDSSSTAHLLWIYDISGNMELFYKNNSAGTFSGPDTQISNHYHNDTNPDISIDSSNVVHLTWTAELASGQADIMYANISSGIVSKINVTKTPFSPEAYSRLSIDTGTNPDSVYLAWIGISGNQIQPFISDNRKGDFCPPRFNYDISENTSSTADLVVVPYEGLTYLAWSGNDLNDLEIYLTEDYQPITILSPRNISYSYQNIPVQVVNSSRHLTQVWCRNRTSSGMWSSNYTLTWDGNYFSNSSAIYFNFTSSTLLQVFSNDSNGRIFSVIEYLGYDSTPPMGFQWYNTTSNIIQKANRIWINGTAWDLDTGVSSITIYESNTSGGVTDWSTNIGNNYEFAFYNTSPLNDNLFGQLYEINVSIVNGAAYTFILTCNVTVEINPPYGSQSPSTNLSNPQRGDVNSYIWVNGTAGDDGFGVANVTIHNTTHPGNPWSTNLGTNQNWAFNNISTVQEGQWEIQINLTDYANNSVIIVCNIFVDTMASTGSQWANTTTPTIQKTSTIWINGTYSDPSPSSGIQSITIASSNTSGGTTDWSANLGFGQNFAFYNVSPLADNSFNGFYEIIITIIDNAGNEFNLTCRVTVEINPPSGSQDAATQAPTRGDVNGRVWVNGTASDLGFGMKNVIIQWSNHSGWSSNQGTLNLWAFYNTSTIGGGLWEIQINVTDLANNSAIIICYVYVDFVAPTGIQSASTNLSSPQNGDPNEYIWLNGTASDGGGVGMLNVTIVWTNHTGNPWSLNLGTNESWSFRNSSTIIDGIWEITVTLTDLLGNARNITCYIFVDTVAPTGLQDLLTQAFQTTDQNGLVWINGSASDINGSGILDVAITGMNGTGTWSSNQNTTDYWVFSNTSAIYDGSWAIYINITDRAYNSLNFTAYIQIDTTTPSGAQDAATLQPQNAANGYIWINGTATDGSGVGILEVSILTTNHTPTNVWSVNLGTNESWSFNNISTINDGSWLVVINMTDKAGNSQLIFAFVKVDTTAPQGSQDAKTVLPQSTDLNGRVWVNGTATDGNGTGLSSVAIVWTNGTAAWSANIGTNTNWAFYNTTPVPDGTWEIRINLVDVLSNSRNITCVIFVDNTAPAGTQDPLTNSSYYQETVQIWVNGTASDVNGSGIVSVSVVIGMGTAPNTWSSNQGTNASWAFTNTSAIPTDQSYWIMVNITDKMGHDFLLNCSFRVELNPPQGTQDAITALPQKGDAQGYIWINGTAFDGGSGVWNVSITYTNSSTTFSSNLGDNTTWAFRNESAIQDGVWNVTITIFDIAGHSTNVSGLIIVDTIAPSQPINGSYSNPTTSSVLLTWNPVIDNTTVTYYIYRNGTSIGNTTLTFYLDSGLSRGTYIYYIIPVDAAGNSGPASANITVIISGGGPSPGIDDITLIIIIVVGIGAVAVGTIAVRRRKKKPRARPRPSIRLEPTRAAVKPVEPKEPTITPKESKILLADALKEKTEEAPKKLAFFMIEEGKPTKEPEFTLEVEEEAFRARREVHRAEKEAKPEVSKERVLPKVVHFTFYCPTCKKWFGLEEYAKVDCPICKNPLKLSYACPNCKNRFTLKEPGVYNCPRCKTTKLVP